MCHPTQAVSAKGLPIQPTQAVSAKGLPIQQGCQHVDCNRFVHPALLDHKGSTCSVKVVEDEHSCKRCSEQKKPAAMSMVSTSASTSISDVSALGAIVSESMLGASSAALVSASTTKKKTDLNRGPKLSTKRKERSNDFRCNLCSKFG